MIAVSVCLTYPVQFYVPFSIVEEYIKKKYSDSWLKQRVIEYVARIGIVLLTFFFAELIPHLGLFISLVGSLAGACLALVFPAIIDTICEYDGRFWEIHYVLIVFRNFCFFILGILGLVVGTALSIRDIVNAFE
ncbi:unnamed protein product [Soboliphyme baturini]|uniref:Aa_trans domain-containing protein n=1 Tax=Soboliphyme baturini TaxID=241478 RepID=A0A183ILS1_9BILA|nr:unnamed protein product [Soboliphyme baturini]